MLLEEREIAPPAVPEAEVVPGDDDLRADPPEHALGELLGLLLLQVVRELEHECLLDPGVLEELEPALKRREQLDVVPEHEARVRVERDGGGAEPGVDDGLEDAWWPRWTPSNTPIAAAR